ncbi:RsmB/NOP family class I SAM-dependent RNA methyltransferase [Altererythrobacter rubellus]|jgi:16S rRNA (cytosine967-C5)-methyltransferase|uniref:RsmB/NOP family class I SAM-dependent RNA methyltransferase n=1 Tax=Altererythrobacter rubellus TaxID=2173831 RepID=A0A9Y2F5E1_9SPHN|nr:RsmB/NOP family class I SAM-dependent RNA methyltransferase [Altererythrobacter rubellus]WIW94722.1 RsmB/NOP family class I SAM-dependent RNA methyltransferase [Altererythrobacter rubellus]
MTPAARVQAAIELLDQIIDAAKSKGAPADRLIANYFKQRRYAGSKDRRAVRELVYAAVRACGPIPVSGRAAMLRLAEQDDTIAALFDGSAHGAAAIGDEEKPAPDGVAPDWLTQALTASGIDQNEAAALLDRAPLDIRVNTLKADRSGIELPETGEPLAASQALRFSTGTSVEQWPAYRDGRIEVQDHGSQLVCEAFSARPGETVVDLCAGAGGKSLALASAMQNQGRLLACDTNRGRLSRLAPRAERAGAGLIETLLLNPDRELEMLAEWRGVADAVLVDAPCSGTGTWRRNPEARWRLDEGELTRLTFLQDRLIDIAAAMVKPGGRIGFVTCSLLDVEGKDRIAAALERHPKLKPIDIALPLGRAHGAGVRLSPAHDGTDGFFVAMLRAG